MKHQELYENPSYFKNISDAGLNGARAQWIVDKFKPTSVLELGAGRFTLTQALRNLGVTAWGIDWSMTACRFAPECAVRAPVQTIPFGDKSFDLSTAFDILEHLEPEDVEKAIHEIWRVSRKWIVVNLPLDEPENSSDNHPTLRQRPFWEAMFNSFFEETPMGIVGWPPTFNCGPCLFLLKPRETPLGISVRI